MSDQPKIILYTAPNTMSKVLGSGAMFVPPQEPLGLMYIAGYLEQNGYSVTINDAFSFGLSGKDILQEIQDKKPDIVGFSMLTSGATVIFELTKEIKRRFPQVLVVLGNEHANTFAEYLLKNQSADIIIHGEGEDIFLQTVKAFEKKSAWENVKGISYIENGMVKRTPPSPLIIDLDEIPLPARHLVPINKYRTLFYFHPYSSSKYYKVIMTSRGCPFRCTFCSVHHSRTIRYHSIKRVQKELDLLVNDYKSKFVFFIDSLFMSSNRRINDICEGILQKNLSFDWGCEGRVNLGQLNNLKVMKKAGCYIISYGIESGVQSLLNTIQKDCTLEQIEAAVRYTKEAKMKAMGLFILGLPGETRDMTMKTIDFAKKLPLDFAQFAILTPFPGSKIYDDLVKANKIDIYDWNRYSQYAYFTNQDPIWVTESLTPQELKEMSTKAIFQFFLRPRPILYLLSLMRFHNLKEYVKIAKSVLSI